MYFQGLNAVMESDRDIKCMGVWGLGNVNDAAFALNGMRRATDPRIVNLADDESHVHDYYPLTLYADSRHTCFAMSYVSLGITGWFAGEINKDNVRKKLREQRSNRFTSTLHVARMYLGGGFESSALPRRSHGSPSGRERTETSSSDTVYMNGPRMAGFVHSGVDYGFLPYSMRTDIDIHNHPFVAAPLVGRMLLSNIMPIEGVEEQVHWLEFAREAGVTPVQCDGDQLLLKGVRRISIAKRDKLPVLRPRKSPIRENGRFRSIVAKQ